MSEPLFIADHLLYSEMACPCCGRAIITPELEAAWESFRNELGKPVQILSGYRCKNHNRSIGGATRSQHMYGNALDIACRHALLESEEIYRLLIRCGFRGIGHGRGIFHIDTRETHYFWRYVSGGEAIDRHLLDLYNTIMKEKDA